MLCGPPFAAPSSQASPSETTPSPHDAASQLARQALLGVPLDAPSSQSSSPLTAPSPHTGPPVVSAVVSPLVSAVVSPLVSAVVATPLVLLPTGAVVELAPELSDVGET